MSGGYQPRNGFAAGARPRPPGHGAAAHRPVALQRQIVEALGRCKLSLGALVTIANAVLPEPAPPPGAEDPFGKVRRALAGAGNLQAQLIGVIAYEALSDATLRNVAAALVSASAAFEDEEIASLRVSLRGQRS